MSASLLKPFFSMNSIRILLVISQVFLNYSDECSRTAAQPGCTLQCDSVMCRQICRNCNDNTDAVNVQFMQCCSANPVLAPLSSTACSYASTATRTNPSQTTLTAVTQQLAGNPNNAIAALNAFNQCATNGRDNTACCQASGVPAAFLPLCNGQQQITQAQLTAIGQATTAAGTSQTQLQQIADMILLCDCNNR
ncbi:DB module domain-containing protein [Ditylenchus destructor]|uniref:DB module domain-containing protein n=1 Tax=Ditylenchus destructor TaxID=166010 RepID=A0AAD4MWH1_9BILA|nr:DB module domain-containing protein [Ditylenchus destructor]